MGEWAFLFDGNHFMMRSSWQHILQSISNNPHWNVLTVPMMGLKEQQQPQWLHYNADPKGLVEHASDQNTEEPQVALRVPKFTTSPWDETKGYGKENKVAFLVNYCGTPHSLAFASGEWRNTLKANCGVAGVTVRMWTWAHSNAGTTNPVARWQKRETAMRRFLEKLHSGQQGQGGAQQAGVGEGRGGGGKHNKPPLGPKQLQGSIQSHAALLESLDSV